MDRTERVVLTNMCMVEDDEGRLLVQDRNDPGWPGLVFPGGHVERNESFVGSVIREVYEETGLTIESPRLCGVKQFVDGDGHRYIVLFFKANRFSGVLRSSDEGRALWVRRDELQNYRRVTTFDTMLRVFDEEGISEHYEDPETGEIRLM